MVGWRDSVFAKGGLFESKAFQNSGPETCIIYALDGCCLRIWLPSHIPKCFDKSFVNMLVYSRLCVDQIGDDFSCWLSVLAFQVGPGFNVVTFLIESLQGPQHLIQHFCKFHLALCTSCGSFPFRISHHNSIASMGRNIYHKENNAYDKIRVRISERRASA